MKHKFLYRFSQVIVGFRRDRRIAQKDLALTVGIDPPRLSALERGRVLGPSTDLVRRFCVALELSAVEAEQLQRAAAHDRVMREITRSVDRDRHELLAKSLDAAHVLSQEDCEALAEVIRQLVEPRQKLATLLDVEGEAMT